MIPDISQFPDSPGVYLMKDSSGNIIYIGKARSLKQRVSQYFQSSKYHSPKTRVLVRNIADVEYIASDSEVEALILEANLIKRNQPRYNINLKDDKRYPYVKVTVNTPYPRIYLTRRRLMDGALYFGPYTSVKPVRKTLDIIANIFKLRRCRKRITKQRQRPCLNYHIDRCLAPCTGTVDPEEYREQVMAAVGFLRGKTSALIGQLDQTMHEYANSRQFEAAAMMRDQIAALEELGKQQTSTHGTDDRDVIASASDEGAVYVQLFYIRDGTMVGRADFTLTRGDGQSDIPEVIAEFIKQYYLDAPVPPEILVEHPLPEQELLEQWLSQRSGRHVQLRTPLRGSRRKILEMTAKNADLAMEQAHLKRQQKEPFLQSLSQLKEALSLQSIPHRIEGFDISNISGSNAVGSMVAFDEGIPSNTDYRHFNIRTVTGIDDPAMMGEVVERRYSRLVRNGGPFPDLILVDGGPTQVSAAQRRLEELGLDIPLIGLAKRFEHIITTRTGPGQVIILPHASPALKLLMQVRDEAHRFAVSFHRQRRSAKLTHSALDAVAGIGPAKKRVLLEHFQSVEGVREASVDDIMQVQGIGKELAYKIKEHLTE
ncbi:MAG: excinuclease ABC subunit UvrC [Euryarchaeota archaeon]|nr:excinuclease ABC subunit UvrC [Euryarchaeota archaeon]